MRHRRESGPRSPRREGCGGGGDLGAGKSRPGRGERRDRTAAEERGTEATATAATAATAVERYAQATTTAAAAAAAVAARASPSTPAASLA